MDDVMNVMDVVHEQNRRHEQMLAYGSHPGFEPIVQHLLAERAVGQLAMASFGNPGNVQQPQPMLQAAAATQATQQSARPNNLVQRVARPAPKTVKDSGPFYIILTFGLSLLGVMAMFLAWALWQNLGYIEALLSANPRVAFDYNPEEKLKHRMNNVKNKLASSIQKLDA